MVKQLIAGNWKMNGLTNESVSRVKDLLEHTKVITKADILICPPFTLLSDIYKIVKNSNIFLGAQDCYIKENGAFTGSVSATMLKDIGCNYVILGHSERRMYNNETNAIIKQKISSAINANLIPILCIGETKEEKENNQTLQVLKVQLQEVLTSNINSSNLVVAYEPVWAIGTGLVPTLQEIEETHLAIKKMIAEITNNSNNSNIKVLYGGSLNAKNCQQILPLQGVGGGLIGGASLINTDFITIINSSTNNNL